MRKANGSRKSKAASNGELHEPRRGDALLSPDECSNAMLPAISGYSLPPRCFSSEDFYRAEVEKIFMREWLCVGRADEVPKAGDYYTLRIAEEPLIVTRDERGAVRAFSNVCPHRASVIAEGKGHVKHFECPYHGWTFSPSGKLVGSPFMNKTVDFDKKDCRLPELRVEIWEGFTFVNFDPAAKDLAPRLAGLKKKIGRYRFADLKADTVSDLENDCNWKIGFENAIDEYHAFVVHRSLTPPKFYHLKKTFAEADPGGAWAINFTPSVNPYPYVTGTSATSSPYPAISGLSAFEMQSFNVLGIFPNTILALNPDAIITLLFFPLSPGRTAIRINMNYPKSTFDIPDFGKQSAESNEALIFTNEQDMLGCRLAQKGVGSRFGAPGRLSYLEEAVRYFDSYIVRMMMGNKAGAATRSGAPLAHGAARPRQSRETRRASR